mmetsp:Transcript_5886/g.14659  ORF Transcript_5886/g.14659 Transcript_5886/m.14659 type:complete len:152 (+) Transcript_5886:2686-3141(+)
MIFDASRAVCSSCVARMTHLCRSRPRNTSLRRWPATCASTADNTSSNTNTSASFTSKIARAIATRAFCPPESVTPRSPIWVSSPLGSTSMSASRAEQRRVFSYSLSRSAASVGRSKAGRCAWSEGCEEAFTWPHVTLSRSVLLHTHGDWAQ